MCWSINVQLEHRPIRLYIFSAIILLHVFYLAPLYPTLHVNFSYVAKGSSLVYFLANCTVYCAFWDQCNVMWDSLQAALFTIETMITWDLIHFRKLYWFFNIWCSCMLFCPVTGRRKRQLVQVHSRFSDLLRYIKSKFHNKYLKHLKAKASFM